MIVSCINSPFFNLASFLKDVIDKGIKKNFSYIKNSFDMVKKINDMPLQEDYQNCIIWHHFYAFQYSQWVSIKKCLGKMGLDMQ